MDGQLYRPRIPPPTALDIATITETFTGFYGASNGEYLGKSGGIWAWSTPSGTPGGSDTQIQYNSSGSFAGSSNLTYDGTNLDLLTPSGSVRIGDGAGSGHGTSINLASTQVAFACGGSFRFTITTTYMYVTSPSSTVQIGDPEDFGNSTKLIVDDANTRATFNKKFVITDTGAFYIYDSGTSTYWKWESISGAWTGTDTGSASLP